MMGGLFAEVAPARITRLSSHVYTWLWRLGLCGAFFSYLDSFRRLQEAPILGSILAPVLASVTIAHQWTVYTDVHFIEDSPTEARVEYPAWLNTRLERWIRTGIIVALLFGVGKIADALHPLAARIPYPPAREEVTAFLRPPDDDTESKRAVSSSQTQVAGMVQAIPSEAAIHRHSSKEAPLRAGSLFVMGSLAAFLLLTLWNGFALYFRVRSKASGLSNEQLAQHWLIMVRIALFLVASILSSLYWYAVFSETHLLYELTDGIFLLYFVPVAVLFAVRFEKPRLWAENSLAGVIRTIREPAP